MIRVRINGLTFLLLLFCLVAVLAQVGCVTGPKTEKKSKLNYLNGEHYQNQANIMGVPVVRETSKATKLHGQVMVKSGSLPMPLRNQRVELWRQNRLLAETRTDGDGRFNIEGVLENGAYNVQIASEKYAGATPVTIDRYEIDGIMILATERP